MKPNDRKNILYEDPKMDEDDRDHFGMYHRRDAYMPINDNDLWDLEYLILKELTFAIRKMVKNQWMPAGNCFRANPEKYYIDKYELKNFTEEGLLKLLAAIEKLIEFKEKLKTGWPFL